MVTSSPISGLAGAGLFQPAKLAEGTARLRRDITLAALSQHTQTREFLDFKQRTSLQHVRDYVSAAVKGPQAGALQARITTIEGLYAMTALTRNHSGRDGAPDLFFTMLAASHGSEAFSRNNLLGLL